MVPTTDFYVPWHQTEDISSQDHALFYDPKQGRHELIALLSDVLDFLM